MIFAIGKGLCGGDGDRISGVHAHGIEILDGADDDDVVTHVTHHFEFVLFPSQHRFFDQSFVHWREIETAGEHFHQFFAIVGNAAATAAQRERWTNDDGETNFPGELKPIFQIID